MLGHLGHFNRTVLEVFEEGTSLEGEPEGLDKLLVDLEGEAALTGETASLDLDALLVHLEGESRFNAGEAALALALVTLPGEASEGETFLLAVELDALEELLVVLGGLAREA